MWYLKEPRNRSKPANLPALKLDLKKTNNLTKAEAKPKLTKGYTPCILQRNLNPTKEQSMH
jgi:hypothetical protein